MALETPTIKAINDNIVAQMDATFGTSLPKSFVRVLAKTVAAIFILLYKYCGFNFLQMFVSTASMSPTEVNGRTIVPLIEWGRLIGAGDPRASEPAELIVLVTVEVIGSTLPAAVQLVYVPTGAVYITTESVVLDSPTVNVNVIATAEFSGTQGNLGTGAVLSFANPLSGVARSASVVSQSVTGADAETPDQYRERVVNRFQLRPQGGAYTDYKLWAEETTGVLRAYPYASDFPGQVEVYIESATEVDGIPTTAQLEAALDSINYEDATGKANRRPITALPNTLAIIRVGFSVEIQGLSVENEPDVRAEIESALTSYFLGRAPFLIGLSIPPRADRITQPSVNGVIDDIVSLNNGTYTAVVLRKGAVITASYMLQKGEKAKLSGVTYT